jgi:hypothetical protein
MSQPRLSLDVLHVPSPCTVPWKSMNGTERVRHCNQCAKNVYNLSAMTADEANDLLASAAETPCVRFYRRYDGTVVTAERCSNGFTRTWRWCSGTLAAVFFGLMSLAGCDRSTHCIAGEPVPTNLPKSTAIGTSTSTTTTVTSESKK